MIYLDNAATSYYRPPQVAQAVAEAMESMGNSARGSCEPSMRAARMIFRVRSMVNRLFHGSGPEQTVFTGNVTESLNIAIKGLLKPGDLAVTTVLDHNSVLRPLYEMERLGVRLRIAGCDSRGTVDYEGIEKGIRAGARAVVCTHASNLTGNVVDIRRIGKLCREQGTLFVVDAAQTAGEFPIDMEKDCIDVLCFTGHKSLMGPQGTGGLCVRRGMEIRPLISGGSGIRTFDRGQPPDMPEALEAGTLNGHGLAGLKAALEYLEDQGIEKLTKRKQELAWEFYRGAVQLPGIRVYGDFTGPDRAPIVALNVAEEDSGKVSGYLAERFGICTRSGGHCAPLMHRALGTEIQGAVRFSFSHFNTEGDIQKALAALVKYEEEMM